jgi:hypothetical protein
MGMNRREIMESRFGEMLDMISCFSIWNGQAKEKKHRKFTYEEAIALR